MREIAWVPRGVVPRTVHRLAQWTGQETEHSGSPMPTAALLILDETSEGWYLLRYADSGEFGGDTWHATADEAKHQASFEFGEVTWEDAPAEPKEVNDLAEACVASRKTEGG